MKAENNISQKETSPSSPSPENTITLHCNNLHSLDIDSMLETIRSDLLRAREKKENFSHTYSFGKVVEPTLVISSTFPANSILPTLSPLLREFSTAKALVTYNDFSNQLLNPKSQFHHNKRGINILLFRFGDFRNKQADIELFKKNINEIYEQIKNYSANSKVPLVLCSGHQISSMEEQVIEEDFLKKIIEEQLAYVIKASDIQSYYFTANPYNKYAEKEGDIPYTLDYFNSLSKIIARVYYALSTSPKKVIVVDCDDTLWKGKVGEDGIDGLIIDEPRKVFQKFLVEKSKAGFLICLCSRNNAEDVWAVFDRREDMILKREHIVDWRINWKKKSENILELSQTLSLALNSMIFIDDDPAQIGEVTINCPEVLSLQLPKEDSLIPIFAFSIWGLENFRKNKVSDSRTKHYQNNAKRNDLKESSKTLNEYLKQLDLKTTIRSIGEKDYARVAELMQRSNQFNFNKWSPEQCTEANLRNLINNENYKCLVVDVKDRYDDYGLVGLMLFHKVDDYLLVEAFILSCRALGKGVEHKMLNELSNIFTQNQQERVYIVFKPTQSNVPALTFLNEVHFSQEKSNGHETLYSLPVSVASTVSQPDWEHTPTSSSEESSHVSVTNQVVVDQNNFIKRMIESTLEMSLKKDIKQAISLNSTEDIISYIQNLENYFGLSLDTSSSFVALGFDSTLAVHLVSRLFYDLGVHLDYVSILKPDYTVEKLATLIYEKIKDQSSSQTLARKNRIDSFPLSHEQLRLWSYYNKNSSNAKYNISVSYQLEGNLNLSALESAFRYLLQEEPLFCTVFKEDAQNPIQIINLNKSSNFQWTIQEAQHIPFKLLEEKVNEFINTPFNLENDLLIRVQIFQVADQKFILSVCVPHIIHDAVSLNLLIERLTEYYLDFSNGNSPENKSRYSYIDYIGWQQSESSEIFSKNQLYWRQQLSGKSNTNLPIMQNATPSQKSRRTSFSFDTLITKQLDQIASQSNATSYEVLLTIFSVLLAKYTGKTEVLTLTPTMGRQHPGSAQIMGFFVNLLLINSCLSEEQNLFQAISNVQKIARESLEHQDYPFANMLSFLERSDNLLPISFVFQNYKKASLTLKNVQCARIFSDNDSLLYDMSSEIRLGPLTVYMRKEDDQLKGLIEYDEALFSEQSIQQFIKHFQELASKLVTQPSQPVLNHSLLTPEESEQLLNRWNHSENISEEYRDIVSLFKSQVEAHPEHIAIISGDIKLSYAELDKRSTLLCAYLQQNLSLTREDCVAICLPRNHHEAIAILAILKAGCAYVPINQADSSARIEYILDNTKSKAVLVTHKQSIFTDKCQRILIDDDSLFSEMPLEITNPIFIPNQLTYIMYTSGSTGNPKGVLIEQQGIVRLVISPGYMEFKSEDKIAQLSNSSFDAATLEFWGGLLNGGTLVYPPQNVLSDIDEFSKFLTTHKITILWLTAALFEQFSFIQPAIFKDLTYLLSGGDVLNPKAVAAVINCSEGKPQHFLNGYGPTENTTFSTVYEIKACNSLQPIPIGSPIRNTETYVLDAQLQPVPIGVPGFLYLGGAGLARGYLGQAEITQSKFLNVTIANMPKRLYSTGDVVYWQPSGNLAYIGRIDNQIKLRGYRIDIREIEQKVLVHSDIKQAAVIVRPGAFLDQRKLILYFVASDSSKSVDIAELEGFLRKELPAYMLPEIFVQKTHLPITANGKIDRSTLVQSTDFEVNLNKNESTLNLSTEEQLKNLIIEVADLAASTIIDLDEKLYELGINSISLIRLSQNIKTIFGVQLSASILLESNIQQLTKLIDEKRLGELEDENVSNYFVEVQAGNPNNLPIIFIHPAGGTTHCYRELIAELGKEQPCYVIEDPSIFCKKDLWKNISEMAAYYLRIIKDQKPAWKNVILSGWSFGGMVAVEMALQNRKTDNGFKVRSLVLLDTWVVSELEPQMKLELKDKVINQYRETYGDKIDPYVRELFTIRQEQGFSYSPSQLVETPIFLCKADSLSAVLNIVDDKNYWEKFAKSIEVQIIPGNHDTILISNGAKNLAIKIMSHIKTVTQTFNSRVKSLFWEPYNNDSSLSQDECEYSLPRNINNNAETSVSIIPESEDGKSSAMELS